MLCDECHENEAVVFYTEIINGEKKELHLCEACAAKETGMDHSFVSLTDTSFLANLLASVLGKRQETDDEENLKKIQGNCEHTGKEPLYGGETVHIPSITADADHAEMKDVEQDIAFTVDAGSTEEELRAALKRAVAKEEYEEAARIRDIIRAGRKEADEHA